MRPHPSLARFFASWLCLAWATAAVAQTVPEAFPRFQPVEPDEAESTFEVQDGFRMQLVAAEPLVADPVDLAYDERGRAYVVEMRDYPFPEEKNAEPTEFPGRVRLLEDRDGDGLMDRSYVFADGFAWPTSVVCYRGGVFLAAAPDIWYLKDNDGDHLADQRQRIFTGFSRYNVQAIMNNLRWGLDNRIYGAASGNGGSISSDGEPAMPITVSGHDFRFDPESLSFQAISGGARFGNSFDDQGNRFVCNIRNPIQHVVFDKAYLDRHPFVGLTSVLHDVADSGDQIPVHRISPPEAWRTFRAQRWSADRVDYPRSELIGAGYWTSSSGVVVYRGNAYPDTYRGNVFIGEVAGNLLHRQRLQSEGVTFRGLRADRDTEFVRSRDTWFRPVNSVNAPDGTLHVLDMYRETIEHPWSIPDDIKSLLDLASGNQRGRIYRLAPPDFRPPRFTRLDDADADTLVDLLAHPNSWHRETAQRLLVERGDPRATDRLRTLLRESSSSLGRLHALWTLEGLVGCSDQDLLAALHDSSPIVVRQALRIAETRVATSAELGRALLQLPIPEDPAVAFQYTLALGAIDDDAIAGPLARLAAGFADDHFQRAAVVSSAAGRSLLVLDHCLADSYSPPGSKSPDGSSETASPAGWLALTKQLALAATALGDDEQAAQLVSRSTRLVEQGQAALGFAVWSGLAEGLQRRRASLAEVLQTVDSDALHGLLLAARELALSADRVPTERSAAIDVLRTLPLSEVEETLVDLVQARHPIEVQRAALNSLTGYAEPRAVDLLVPPWNNLSPDLRIEALEKLTSRRQWIAPLLHAWQRGDLPANQVPTTIRGRLRRDSDETLRQLAETIFGPAAVSRRSDVVTQYLDAMQLPGNAEHGAIVYRNKCATCHRFRGAGFAVGPDLETVHHRSADEILVQILDPNRELAPTNLEYIIVRNDGRIHNGMLVSQSANQIVLRKVQAQDEAIPRDEVESMTSTGRSLMPEGLEQEIPLADMANLITYLLRHPVQPPSAQGSDD